MTRILVLKSFRPISWWCYRNSITHLLLSALVHAMVFILSRTMFSLGLLLVLFQQNVFLTQKVCCWMPSWFCHKHFPEFWCFTFTILCLQTTYWKVLFGGWDPTGSFFQKGKLCKEVTGLLLKLCHCIPPIPNFFSFSRANMTNMKVGVPCSSFSGLFFFCPSHIAEEYSLTCVVGRPC